MDKLTKDYLKAIFELTLTTEYEANRVKCANTIHGSNPTLHVPVDGLLRIIIHCTFFVLCSLSGFTDLFVGIAAFLFGEAV